MPALPPAQPLTHGRAAQGHVHEQVVRDGLIQVPAPKPPVVLVRILFRGKGLGNQFELLQELARSFVAVAGLPRGQPAPFAMIARKINIIRNAITPTVASQLETRAARVRNALSCRQVC